MAPDGLEKSVRKSVMDVRMDKIVVWSVIVTLRTLTRVTLSPENVIVRRTGEVKRNFHQKYTNFGSCGKMSNLPSSTSLEFLS